MLKEELYLYIINNLTDGVYFVDLNRHITFWNKAAENISGYKFEEVLGRPCNDNTLNHIDADGRPLCLVGCPLYATMIDGEIRRANVFLRHKEGHRVPVTVNVFPMYENDKIIGAIEIFSLKSDTVYEDDLVEKLQSSAMNDELTGLPNRRYLQSFLDYKLSEFKRFGIKFAVLFLDIDNFRDFNNTYGHDVGDLVLKGVSKTIIKNVRGSDMFGRWGGEEFVGVFAVREALEVIAIAEKIRHLIGNTLINGLKVTVSVGITIVKPRDNNETILERADKLMYRSKKGGKNRVTHDCKLL